MSDRQLNSQSADLTQVLAANPSLKTVPLFGIIKEVAPTKKAESDEVALC